MAEITFVFLYCICAVTEAVIMCINHKYYGDVKDAAYNLSSYQVISYLIVFILLWIGAYHLYKMSKVHKGSNKSVKCIVNPKINYFMVFWLLAYIVYTLKTGVGVVGRNNSSAYSFIFSMFDVNVVFPIYYILFRENEKYRKVFLFNTISYCVVRLVQGWTGFIINIFMYELFFYFQRKKSKKSFVKIIALVCFMLFGGAFLYKITDPLKLSIRYNIPFSIEMSIPYAEALAKLTSRLSTFCRGSYVLYNIDKIKVWYSQENKVLLEIQDSLRSILPRVIMPDKDFMGLTSCTISSIYNKRVLNSSSSPGIIPYTVALFYCDPLSAIIWSFQYVGYFFIMRKIYSTLEVRSNKQMDILYFQAVISMLSTGTINVLFTQQLMKLIYIIPLLYLFGMIKFRRFNGIKRLKQQTYNFIGA